MQDSRIEYVREVFDYQLHNVHYLNTAVTAAHRSDLDGTQYDGYKSLARLGVSALDLVKRNALIPDGYTRRKYASVLEQACQLTERRPCYNTPKLV